jgi:adenylate cyclase
MGASRNLGDINRAMPAIRTIAPRPSAAPRSTLAAPARRVPLQVTIMALFFAIFAVLAGGLIAHNEHKTSEIVVASANQVFQRAGREVIERVRRKFEPLTAIVDLSAQLDEANQPPDWERFALLEYFAAAQRRRGHVDSLYVGYDTGEFARLLPFRGDAAMRDRFKAPADTEFGLQIIRGADAKRLESWIFLDDALRELGRRASAETDYDPRARPWFTAASAASTAVRTRPYMFSRSGDYGVIVAKRLARGGGVIGADLQLDDLSTFLNELRMSESMVVAIFAESGDVIAYHDPAKVIAAASGTAVRLARVDELGQPVLDRLLAIAREGRPRRQLEFTTGGVEYLASLRALPDEIGRDEHLAIAIPRDDLLRDVQRIRRESLLFSAIGVAVAIPILFLAARSVARPLRRLAREADRIRRFDLASDVEIASRVTEVNQLSASVRSMKEALRGFGRYVPAQVVRNIVEHGLSPELGGERREVTLMFTDVRNFTTMAESMRPEDLMEKVSRYLTEVGSAVIEHGGTIDKYIGDAVMAFWNAPLPQRDHVARACRAALAAAARSAALDREFDRNGEPIMYTRFGLHAAEVVIGNVGSLDRMNYTALGAGVNLAARLEGLNKNYGTQILVSSEVHDAVRGQFAFRSVDLVVPKGATIPSRIYQLVAAQDATDAATRRRIDMVRQWEVVFAAYTARVWPAAVAALERFAADHPGDSLAAVYLERARRHLREPPPADWNGAEVMLSK